MEPITRRSMLCCAAAFGLAGAASAEDGYPSKLIRIVVPLAAGGGTDMLSRAIGQELSAKLKVPVIVENRAGAGTQIGAEAVAKGEPDGYTLLSTSSTTYAINPSLYQQLRYNPAKDFAPVSLTARFPLVLVANPSFPGSSVRDFVARAGLEANAMSYGSPGLGSPHHLAMELFAQRAGIKVGHVPYRGAAPALQDLMGGAIPVMMLDVATAKGPLEGKLIKALGLASAHRSILMPDVPTIAESGYPGYEASAWQGIVVAARTPQVIVDRLSAAVREILADPKTAERLLAQGIEPMASTPREFAAYMESETAKWREVIRGANIKID